MEDRLEIRVHGDASLPALIYLPGVHGDWTLVAGFRAALRGKVRFVEFTYPRTVSWTLADYANAVRAVLIEGGIRSGWFLGESFGSQIMWEILAQVEVTRDSIKPDDFKTDGIILAGGFVCYPYKWLVRIVMRVMETIPSWFGRLFCHFYRFYARARFRKSPETVAGIEEFIARRTPVDLAGIRYRLDLIAESDPSAIASQVCVPIFQLSGGIDPVVPMLPVRRWLKQHCPTYQGSKVIWLADHNVLGTAPGKSAEQVSRWLGKQVCVAT